MDFAAVKIVFNYDMSEDADTYLHRVYSKNFSFSLLLNILF